MAQDDAQLPEKQFFHHDHLGSIVAISDDQGNLVDEFAYDAWGARREATTWAAIDQSTLSDDEANGAENSTLTDRGFTQHEMLDDLGLVHMNGRIYDQTLGRFLSADPFVQAPSNLQSHNRYSYVLNNPLSYSDPSGYFFKKLFKSIGNFFKKHWKTIVVVALSVVTAGAFIAAEMAFIGAFAGGFVGGFSGTLLNGGGFGDALKAGFKAGAIAFATAGITSGVGGMFGNTGSLTHELARATTHGVAQGGFSELIGGDFKSGFIGGFTGSLASHSRLLKPISGKLTSANGKYDYGRILGAGVIGGTASSIGGGKFANGAISGAFQEFYNNQGGRRRGRRNNNSSSGLWKKASAWVHGTLDVAGMVPAVGIVADAANAVIYLAEGDLANAGLAAAAMVPGAGQGVTIGKHAAKAASAVSKRSHYIKAGLPTSGKIRFIPPKNWNPSQPLPRGSQNGYLDKFGNEWVRPKGQIIGERHWDVQRTNGKHWNITQDGRVEH